MKCTNCGQKVPESAKVCGYCGHKLKLDIPISVGGIMQVSKHQPTLQVRQFNWTAWLQITVVWAVLMALFSWIDRIIAQDFFKPARISLEIYFGLNALLSSITFSAIGFLTFLIITKTHSSLKMHHLLWVALGWAATGFALSSYGGLVFFLLGGLTIGVLLRQLESNVKVWHIIVLALAWFLPLLLGGQIGEFVHKIVIQTYRTGGGGPLDTILGWIQTISYFLNGLLLGLFGGGVTLLVWSRVHR